MGQVISAWLCMSPCRSDHIFTAFDAALGIWSLRILKSELRLQPFLLIDRTCRIVTFAATTAISELCSSVAQCSLQRLVAQDSRLFQHIAKFKDSAVSTVSRRSKPSSRTALMGEQPNPWDRLQPQDATSRHRGAKPSRRYGLLGKMSLLSPGYLLSVEQRRFHKQPLDHYALLSHLLDL